MLCSCWLCHCVKLVYILNDVCSIFRFIHYIAVRSWIVLHAMQKLVFNVKLYAEFLSTLQTDAFSAPGWFAVSVRDVDHIHFSLSLSFSFPLLYFCTIRVIHSFCSALIKVDTLVFFFCLHRLLLASHTIRQMFNIMHSSAICSYFI